MSDAPYDVFLFYSRQDQLHLRELAQRLTKRGLRVFFDEWEFVSGQPW